MKKSEICKKNYFIELFVLVFLVFLLFLPSYAQDKNIFLLEDFNDLENWRPLNFPKIKEHTRYSIEKENDGSYLKTESNASASGIVFKKEFNVYKYPAIKWRWKIRNVYKKGNAREKSGDDYPLRVYIIFKYDPEKASFGQKIKYGLAKKLYGEYPPHSSLNYIWANKMHSERFMSNTYAGEAKMVIAQWGEKHAGTWQEEEVNIIDDYRKIFGTDPPSSASIAIMNDSDNTREQSVSYVDYIMVYK